MEESEFIQNFIDITGVSHIQAQTYKEMSNGNLELAIDIFSEQQNNIISNNSYKEQQSEDQQHQIKFQKELQIIWQNPKSIPQSWVQQNFEFSKDYKFGLIQYQNGPCGPLSVINSIIIREVIKNSNDLDKIINIDDVINAIIIILLQLNDNFQIPVQLARWRQYPQFQPNQFELVELNDELNLRKFLFDNKKIYESQGGLLLFIYSVLFTKGIYNIQKEMEQINMKQTPIFLDDMCSDAFLIFLLTGKIQSFSQFNPKTKINNEFFNPSQIGFLTTEENQMGAPVHNKLLSPTSNIWIINGGDHYTIMFTLEKDLKDQDHVNIFHYNALKPIGPKLTQLQIKKIKNLISENISKEEYILLNTFYKPEIGEIDSIIQCNKDDQKNYPKNIEKWKYEISIVKFHDKDLTESQIRPENVQSPKIFQQGEFDEQSDWRCLYCYYNRFKTMCFGLNKAGSKICQFCSQDSQNVGWSLWVAFEELPGNFQLEVKSRYLSKIFLILEKKWPGSQINLVNDEKWPSI